MKANELMVGDLVQNTNGNFGRILGIVPYDDQVRITYEAVVRYHDNSTAYTELNLLQPIFITGEILKKNGFGYIEWDNPIRVVRYYPGEEQFCANMELKIIHDLESQRFKLIRYHNEIGGIAYVHELQHALRICGLKSEIEL